MTANQIHVGDYVRETQTGYRGRVYRIDDRCMLTQDWLEHQAVRFTRAQIEERWFHILVQHGGAVVSCESRLERVEPFDLDNNSERKHFPELLDTEALLQLEKDLR